MKTFGIPHWGTVASQLWTERFVMGENGCCWADRGNPLEVAAYENVLQPAMIDLGGWEEVRL